MENVGLTIVEMEALAERRQAYRASGEKVDDLIVKPTAPSSRRATMRKKLAQWQERLELPSARYEAALRATKAQSEAARVQHEASGIDNEVVEWVSMLDPDEKLHDVHADDVTRALKKGWQRASHDAGSKK